MNSNKKAIFEEMKTFFDVKSLEDVAERLGYSRAAANNWRNRGISDKAKTRFELMVSKQEKDTKELIQYIQDNNPDRPYESIDEIKKRLGIRTNSQLAVLFGVKESEIRKLQESGDRIPRNMQDSAREVERLLQGLKYSFGGMNMNERWVVIHYNGTYTIYDGKKLELINFIHKHCNDEFAEFIELFKKYGNGELLKQWKESLLKIKEFMEIENG